MATCSSSIRNGRMPVHNVHDYGAGDGSGNDEIGIEQAVACAATTDRGVVVFPSREDIGAVTYVGDYHICSNLRLDPAVPVHLVFLPGARLIPANDMKVTLGPNITIEAPQDSVIFDASSGGSFSILTISTVFANWFSGTSGGDIGDRFSHCTSNSPNSLHIRLTGEHTVTTSLNATSSVVTPPTRLYDFRGSTLQLGVPVVEEDEEDEENARVHEAVLDLTGSSDLVINGLKLAQGLAPSETERWKTGVLMARDSGGGAAGKTKFNDCHIQGYYAVSAAYAFAADDVSFTGCRFDSSLPNTHTFVGTKYNYAPLSSVHTSIQTGRGTINALKFYGCRFHAHSDVPRGPENSGLHLRNAGRVQVRGCFFKVNGKAAIHLDQRNSGAAMGVHLEEVYVEPITHPPRGEKKGYESSVFVDGNSAIHNLCIRDLNTVPGRSDYPYYGVEINSAEISNLHVFGIQKIRFTNTLSVTSKVDNGYIAISSANSECDLARLTEFHGIIQLRHDASFMPASNMGSSIVRWGEHLNFNGGFHLERGTPPPTPAVGQAVVYLDDSDESLKATIRRNMSEEKTLVIADYYDPHDRYSGSTDWGGTVPAGGALWVTVSVSGARKTHITTAGHAKLGNAKILLSAHVSAADIVRVGFMNHGTTDVVVPSGKVRVHVWKTT